MPGKPPNIPSSTGCLETSPCDTPRPLRQRSAPPRPAARGCGCLPSAFQLPTAATVRPVATERPGGPPWHRGGALGRLPRPRWLPFPSDVSGVSPVADETPDSPPLRCRVVACCAMAHGGVALGARGPVEGHAVGGFVALDPPSASSQRPLSG